MLPKLTLLETQLTHGQFQSDPRQRQTAEVPSTQLLFKYQHVDTSKPSLVHHLPLLYNLVLMVIL